jgi:hypothetical protein
MTNVDVRVGLLLIYVSFAILRWVSSPVSRVPNYCNFMITEKVHRPHFQIPARRELRWAAICHPLPNRLTLRVDRQTGLKRYFASFFPAMHKREVYCPRDVSWSELRSGQCEFVEVTLNVAELDAKNPPPMFWLRPIWQDHSNRLVDNFCDSADGSLFRIRFCPRVQGITHIQSPTVKEASENHRSVSRAANRRGSSAWTRPPALSGRAPASFYRT